MFGRYAYYWLVNWEWRNGWKYFVCGGGAYRKDDALAAVPVPRPRRCGNQRLNAPADEYG